MRPARRRGPPRPRRAAATARAARGRRVHRRRAPRAARRHPLEELVIAPPRYVIGVDPGYRHTGLVLRAGDRYVAHAIAARNPATYVADGELVPADYLASVVAAIRELEHTAAVDELERPTRARSPVTRLAVAVEGLRPPSPHVRRRDGRSTTDPTHVLAAAVVLGAVRDAYPAALVVPPGRNGTQLLATYPPELVTPAERRQGLNRPAGESALIRHARSAWDVAGTAPLIAAAVRARAAATRP